MKKIIPITLITIILCGMAHFEHNYTRKDCIVTQVNDNFATVKDKSGNVWDIEDKDYKVGDTITLKMHDNFTPSNIEDDIVK